MPTIRANDLQIAYEQAGIGDHRMVLVHGNWASKRWWQPLMQRLPASYRAVALDLRGCGGTQGPDHGYTIAEHATDLRAFLDALGIERAVLVGHSLGGAVVTQLALAAPERVHALVLVAPAPVDGMQIDRQVYAQLPLLKQNRWLLSHALGSTMPGVPNGAFREALIDDAARTRLSAVTGNTRALERWSVAPQLHHLRVPTLIVRGEDDRLITRAHVLRWRQYVANSRLVTIHRCGHSPNVERPDVLAEVVFSFLEEQSPTHAGQRFRHL
jgi:branched-chain amino acid transport system permease protein